MWIVEEIIKEKSYKNCLTYEYGFASNWILSSVYYFII